MDFAEKKSVVMEHGGDDEDDDDGPPPNLVNLDDNDNNVYVNVNDASEATKQRSETTYRLDPTTPWQSTSTLTTNNNNTQSEPNPAVMSRPPPDRIVPAADPNAPDDLGPCPVTILSGFLGAGKTTLIQYILNSPNHGKRIAVIENEYGEGLNIESLIAREGPMVVDGENNAPSSSSLTDLIELPNGCLCCTVKDSLVVTLENLVTRKRQDLDYILIECSGMANPGPIASLFWLDEALDSRLRLDGIVTLCDAKHIIQQLQETTILEATQQIAYADRIILNKVDLVTAATKESNNNTQDSAVCDNHADSHNHLHHQHEATERILQVIRQIHPTAPIRCTSYASIPELGWILNVQCFDGERVFGQLQQQPNDNFDETDPAQLLQQECALCDDPFSTTHDHTHTHAHDHGHSHTLHVSTVSLVRHGSVDRKRMDQWLDSIVVAGGDATNGGTNIETVETTFATNSSGNINPPLSQKIQNQQQQSIFRIKGILSLYQSPESVDYEPQHCVNEKGLDRRRFIVQGVYDLWEIHPSTSAAFWKNDDDDNPLFSTSRHADDDKNDEERCCKIVVIGRFLNRTKLQQGFDACFVDEQ